MTFTGDLTKDMEAASAAATNVAEFVELQLAAGVNPAALASALVGIGADLLAKVVTVRYAASTLAQVARDLPEATRESECEPAPSQH